MGVVVGHCQNSCTSPYGHGSGAPSVAPNHPSTLRNVTPESALPTRTLRVTPGSGYCSGLRRVVELHGPVEERSDSAWLPSTSSPRPPTVHSRRRPETPVGPWMPERMSCRLLPPEVPLCNGSSHSLVVADMELRLAGNDSTQSRSRTMVDGIDRVRPCPPTAHRRIRGPHRIRSRATP